MEDRQKVVFIEDDPNLELIIVLVLRNEGYEICYVDTLSGIQDMTEKDCPNILLLNLEVGNQNALDYLPFIRSEHPSLSVLIASSHSRGEEATRCYEVGTSHYTKRPYDIQEINFLIQRFCKKGNPISNSISIGDYQLELSAHKLPYKQEQSKTLSPKDFKLFYLLSGQLNQPVSREKLFHEIWDGQEVHDNLNNGVSRLRKLLGKDVILSVDAVKGVRYILSRKDRLSSLQLRGGLLQISRYALISYHVVQEKRVRLS